MEFNVLTKTISKSNRFELGLKIINYFDQATCWTNKYSDFLFNDEASKIKIA